eukprot:5360054-Pyramimonas_sp.AAC.1
MFGAHAECVRFAFARDSTHREHVGPRHPCRKSMPIIASGRPAHSRPRATTPAVPVNNYLTVISGWPRMIQI